MRLRVIVREGGRGGRESDGVRERKRARKRGSESVRVRECE